MELKRHPDFPCDAVSAIAVEVERGSDQALRVRYRIVGDIGALVWPTAKAPGARTDELWKSTCLEAFIRPDGGEAYFETNLAPSADWAAYAFTGYREGMRDEQAVRPGLITVGEGEEAGRLEASIDLSTQAASAIRVSVTAVIEEANGRKSYWALAHPPGAPDFHHADGFVLELAPV